MAALVQSYPAQQSSSPVSLMQPRSQPSAGALHGAAQGPTGQHAPNPSRYTASTTTTTTTTTTSSNTTATAGGTGYRGCSTAPVATYAFTSTPSLAKSSSPSSLAKPPPADRPSVGGKPDDTRQTYTSLDSILPDPSLRLPFAQSSSSSSSSPARSVEDSSSSSSSTPHRHQPHAARTPPPPRLPPSTTLPTPSQSSIASPTREKPDRYKRVNRNSYIGLPAASVQPSGLGMAAVTAVSAHLTRPSSSPNTNGNGSGATPFARASPFIGDYEGQLRSQSVDDIHTYRRPSPLSHQASQNRRRSVGPGSMTTESFQNFLRQELANNSNGAAATHTPASSAPATADFKSPLRPGSRRTGSSDSSASGVTSSRASSNRNSVVSTGSNPGNNSAPPSPPHELNIPPRGSSADVSKRTTAPSPLSRSAVEQPPSSSEPDNTTPTVSAKSPTAAEQLTALNDGQRKGMKNRLRRAFSFGSAAELRKASAANLRGEDPAARAKARQERFREEQEVEQARIARRQEAAGLGESIYSGQGNVFAGSTDNLSVSSTASSASIMIRKMGKGIKRSSRSLVGLFRPKSPAGVEPAAGPIAEASTGEVSRITVEAERERVNVNAHAAEHASGGTGFPKLERNSLEMPATRPDVVPEERTGSASSSRGRRRSIVGGEQERAEILAAVRKGILKRSGSASPVARPTETSPAGAQLPEVPQIAGVENHRPGTGTRPATCNRPGTENRSMSVKEGEDYFISVPKVNTSSHSAPASPSTGSRYNVSFSPRITFHDTWPSGEYDRRGEIATCNRLTPLLAQQIKEELNTFKMEMEVHEQSKGYTHFF